MRRHLLKPLIPWLRSVVAFPLGLLAIQLFHLAAVRLLPDAYNALETDAKRLLVIVLTAIAGTIGSFVVAAVAGHRPWLHLGLFFVLMGAIDLVAVRGDLSNQPVWFKALFLVSLPLQVWLGSRLAGTLRRR